MASNFPPVPVSFRPIQHYLKTAQEHEERDLVVCYWSRLYALQVGLKLSSQKADEQQLLIAVMEWLEKTKKSHLDNESITNEVAAQAYLENYAFKLFSYADKQDRESNFGKNVVKAFYTAGMIYDVLLTFGELSEEAAQNCKYAKWKAAYIHNCLKNGETPVPGPMKEEGHENEDVSSSEGAVGPVPMNPASPPYPISPSDPGVPQTPQNTPATGFGNADVNSQPSSINTDPFAASGKPPSPPVEPEKPGGFEPFVPGSAQAIDPKLFEPPKVNVNLSSEQIAKAQKYCKWAGSALNYDDVPTAVENLQFALRLLQTGQDK